LIVEGSIRVYQPSTQIIPWTVHILGVAKAPIVWQVNARMKALVGGFALAVVAFVGCHNDFTQANRARPAGADDLILRAHFIGSEQLLKDKEAGKLKEIWNLKASADLRNEALTRFSHLPFLWLSNSLPKNSLDQPLLFRPILEDAMTHESFVEWRTTAFALAARLPAARAQVWDANLRQAISIWRLGTPAPLTGAGASGWELSKAGAPSVRFTRAGDWATLTVGHGAAGIESNVLAGVKQFAKPGGAWLEGDANLAEFKRRVPWLDNFSNLPVAHFSLSNRADFVRTLVRLDFPKAHQWKAEPWMIPTNMLWDPLTDFTAARGISRVLDEIPLIHNSGWSPVPSQFCGWGNRNLPFQLFYAAPSRNVNAQLRRAEPKLRAEINRLCGSDLVGSLGWGSNKVELMWHGLPLATPGLVPVKDGGEEFVVVQFFPMIKSKERPPQELFAQIAGRDDLVVYDWESTEFRLPHWRQMYQLAEIATRRALTPTNTPAQRWQFDLATNLDDTVTELRATSPTQMTLVRKSTIGLTAFELVTLSRWIESTNFPAFGIFPPQPPPPRPPGGGASKSK
jgi:hypothetical protein